MNDGAVTPTPLVQSLGLGQLNCRRLWSRDGSIHDGFMGLVSCLDQLDLQVLCVQETQSPPMSSLPMDQPFRYDGPIGSHGREAGFLFHSSIVATPIPGTPDSQSLRWAPHLRISVCLLILRATCWDSLRHSHPVLAVETDFGQSDFGHPYPTDFGQSDFGQSDFGQTDFAKSTLAKPTLANVKVLVVCKDFGFSELIVWVF